MLDLPTQCHRARAGVRWPHSLMLHFYFVRLLCRLIIQLPALVCSADAARYIRASCCLIAHAEALLPGAHGQTRITSGLGPCLRVLNLAQCRQAPA